MIMDIHIPSSSRIRGRSITAAVWKTSVLKKEMSAEVSPSLRAVKNPESKMAKPANRNENALLRRQTVKYTAALHKSEAVIFLPFGEIDRKALIS